MSRNIGYIALTVAVVMIFAAVLVPIANTKSASDCVANVAQGGKAVGAATEACSPAYLPLIAASEVEETPEPEPTETAQPTSQPTGTPPATTTPNPTTTPGATRVARAPYHDAPACADHDPRAYHGLWDATRGCHYDHVHGDNPHEVDDVFGTAFFAEAGGDISYPWQTPNENDYKHGAYYWLVRRDLPCESRYADGCITDFRAQFHGVGAAHGAVTSYHSAALEARVCLESDPNACGTVRIGGWQGPVDLVVDGDRVLDRPNSENRLFLHYYDTGNRNYGTWYTGADTGFFGVIPQFEDMWNTVPPGNTAEEIMANSEWFCADASGNVVYDGCANNSSRIQAHVIQFQVPPRYQSTVDPDGDGFADYDGFVNLYGEIDPSCTAIGPECAPLVLENVPLSAFQYRGDTREYDLCFAPDGSVADCSGGNEPSGWIKYPIEAH